MRGDEEDGFAQTLRIGRVAEQGAQNRNVLQTGNAGFLGDRTVVEQPADDEGGAVGHQHVGLHFLRLDVDLAENPRAGRGILRSQIEANQRFAAIGLGRHDRWCDFEGQAGLDLLQAHGTQAAALGASRVDLNIDVLTARDARCDVVERDQPRRGKYARSITRPCARSHRPGAC